MFIICYSISLSISFSVIQCIYYFMYNCGVFREAPVDYNFYTKFWSLQDFFREPTQCYNKVLWKKFSTVFHFCHIVLVFSKLQNF